MTTNPPQATEGRNGALSSLTASVEALNIAKQNSGIRPARTVFGSASVLLTTIRELMANEQDYVELGLSCANICRGLDRVLDGRRIDDLSETVLGAIEKLTTTVAAIQTKIVKQGKRNPVSSAFHTKSDKEMVAAWGREFDRILHIFNAELSINNHVMLLDIRREVRAGQGGADGRNRSTKESVPVGELPPPRPRVCFGRDALIKKIVGLANTLNPIALIGAGGIGKTSVVLALLHHDRVKDRFGDNRRFIRCDEFPASCANFLRRISQVIGAGVENPENLVPLRSFLSSEEMLIVLDNAESILDPQGAEGKEIYRVVEELGQFDNICLTITSRITTVPPDCETVEVPTLSMEAAHETFYRIYKYGGRSDPVNEVLRQLDFHPLSATLLATIAHQNRWDNGRLAREWERRQTGVLRTEHSDSLAATIELSLASPMFKELGPDARELLGVIAFFPQGVDENNLDWLFPAIPNINDIFDKFCILSLAHRSGTFVTMLAPLRDYLRPMDPTQSSLLRTAEGSYFTRLSDGFISKTSTAEGRWIASEDVNVEHLLDVLTSVDTNSKRVWDACHEFMAHLNWHKPRQTVLRSKIERLPDDHPSKPICLLWLSNLFSSMGNVTEQKYTLIRNLELCKKQGMEYWIAQTLLELSKANRMLGLNEEGLQEVRGALEIVERIGNTADRATCLNTLAFLLLDSEQLDAAQDTASHALTLWDVQEVEICRSHRILGEIHSSKGEREKAIHHFEVALKIASTFKWHNPMFWIRYSLARLFYGEDMLDDAQAHVTQAKLYAADDTFCLSQAMEMQARIWYRQNRLEDAMSEALRASGIFEKFGATMNLGYSKALLRDIERAMESQATPAESNSSSRDISPSTPANAS